MVPIQKRNPVFAWPYTTQSESKVASYVKCVRGPHVGHPCSKALFSVEKSFGTLQTALFVLNGSTIKVRTGMELREPLLVDNQCLYADDRVDGLLLFCEM